MLRYHPTMVKTLDTGDKSGRGHEYVSLRALLELCGGAVDPGVTCGLKGIHRPSTAWGTPASIWFKFIDEENPCHPWECRRLGENMYKWLYRASHGHLGPRYPLCREPQRLSPGLLQEASQWCLVSICPAPPPSDSEALKAQVRAKTLLWLPLHSE